MEEITMSRRSQFHWSVVLLAAWSMVLPQSAYCIETSQVRPITLPEVTARDVVLDDQGVLHGTLTNAQGQPRATTELVVRRGGRLLTTTTSQPNGKFAIRDLRPGLYEINTDRSYGLYRIWAPRSAPPVAQPGALIVERATVIRAQEWNAWRRALILGGVIITSGVIGGVIGYNIKDDDAS
jgi:hypothetical protein